MSGWTRNHTKILHGDVIVDHYHDANHRYLYDASGQTDIHGTSQPHNLLCMCHRRTTSRIEMTTQRMVRAKFSHHCRRQCKRILEVSGQFIRYKNMVQKINATDSLHSLVVPHKAHRYLTRRSTTTATKTSMTVKTTMPTRSLKLWSSERTSRFVSES